MIERGRRTLLGLEHAQLPVQALLLQGVKVGAQKREGVGPHARRSSRPVSEDTIG